MHFPIAARRCWIAISCAVLVTACGCSGDSSTGELSGRVTLDGQPLDNAQIRFQPIDGLAPTTGGSITNGQYSVRLPVTKHRVEISATRMPAGKAVEKHSSVDIQITQLVPAKYNTSSELTVDVKPGKNEQQFELKSR